MNTINTARRESKADRFRQLDKKIFDAIVIGAGIGGLVSAALLAKRGKSVLVVDMHYALGGCATVFHRGGRAYEFDVGLHYVGDCGVNGLIPRILQGAGINNIEWVEQDPEGFDLMQFPDFQFAMPRGYDRFRERLLQMFPSEQKGINRYMRLLKQIWDVMGLAAHPWQTPLVIPRCPLVLRYGNGTVDKFLDSCTQNKRLRAILTGQLGVYHQPPSRAALAGHAGVTNHFLQGSFYPKGGGQAVSNALADVIENNGGKILLRTKVDKIRIIDGQACGLEMESKKIGRLSVAAPTIISNADYKSTMLNLVGAEHLSRKKLEHIDSLEMAPAMGIIYLGVKRDLRAEGYSNANIRLYPSYDFEKCYQQIFNQQFVENPHVFISSATLKDPDNPALAPVGMTNIQLMSAVPNAPQAWGISEVELRDGSYSDNPAYLQCKENYAQKILEIAEQAIPNLRQDIDFCEVATPFSATRFAGVSGGTAYGLAMIPEQFLLNRPSPKSPIKNLFLCGGNLRTGHGIFGAMTSGVEAASMALGGRKLARQVLQHGARTR